MALGYDRETIAELAPARSDLKLSWSNGVMENWSVGSSGPITAPLQYSITPVPQSPMRHPSLLPLSHDHHHGLALALRCRKQGLGQIKPMGAEGLRERAKEFLEFYRANLVAHFSAEEEVLFPLMRATGGRLRRA